jgi:uncharacterized membrane protein YoaK (UPF0700 family)
MPTGNDDDDTAAHHGGGDLGEWLSYKVWGAKGQWIVAGVALAAFIAGAMVF